MSSAHRAVVQVFLGAALLLQGGCDLSSEVGWARFNADDQTVTISVGDDAPTDALELTLLSTTEAVEVGTMTVTPGGGPVGTEHEVTVNVADAYEDQVGRVTVATSGERGTQVHVLVQDSADLGLWQVSMESLGDQGESREDEVLVRLWTPAAEDEESDPDAEDDA